MVVLYRGEHRLIEISLSANNRAERAVKSFVVGGNSPDEVPNGDTIGRFRNIRNHQIHRTSPICV